MVKSQLRQRVERMQLALQTASLALSIRALLREKQGPECRPRKELVATGLGFIGARAAQEEMLRARLETLGISLGSTDALVAKMEKEEMELIQRRRAEQIHRPPVTTDPLEMRLSWLGCFRALGRTMVQLQLAMLHTEVAEHADRAAQRLRGVGGAEYPW
eukprot:Skav223464  [mRNA]  locus=scaffold2238:30618:33529:+ [translate_table: standard]